MRARKPILVVTMRPDLRFVLRTCDAHVVLKSVESREELKVLALTSFAPVMAVVDSRGMQAEGVEAFVSKVRESFAHVKILLISKHGDPRLFGADLAVRGSIGLSFALIETVKQFTILQRGPRKGVKRHCDGSEAQRETVAAKG